MTQPPYPPQGGNESGGEQPGDSGWGQPANDDDPTKQFDRPETAEGQRQHTQQFPQPGTPGAGRAGETRQIQPGELSAAAASFGQPGGPGGPGQPPQGQ